jgi:hypothetical protein
MSRAAACTATRAADDDRKEFAETRSPSGSTASGARCRRPRVADADQIENILAVLLLSLDISNS